jgi:farnesyl diphosphate synthase
MSTSRLPYLDGVLSWWVLSLLTFPAYSHCLWQLQAFFLVSDDIMDQSVTRRGQPCWYKNEGVGNIAINDSVMLEAAIYHLLKSHFRKETYYVDLLELFHEVSRL